MSALLKPVPRPVPDYRRYEQLKREWIDYWAVHHNQPNPETYDMAIRRIARECGV